MEQNIQVVAKKLWHIVRVAFFMVRKSLNKRKLLLELKYLTMKRPKLAGKPFTGKLTHHHHHKKRAHNHGAPIKEEEESELQSVNKVLDMMFTSKDVEGSPFPNFYSPMPWHGFGFGHSPVVRVTDSPYPLNEVVEVGNFKVDEAAEEFIQRFYEQLRQ